ncbi:hypothetical protein [Pseudescherichia sp. L3]|uniref:hypothetical protein n=1 Tax=Pseudescherichia sp. L3 TaxID=2970817 RepID=UPI00215012C6|nr:hypothetical protein [Pseudescherichia sp. L3]MCR4457026.1 hypothetical protein [Pseudescherichia sp. L3]
MVKLKALLVPNTVFNFLDKETLKFDLSNYDVCTDLFDKSIACFEDYFSCVETGSNKLPKREDIGLAGYWLLTLAGDKESEKYWKVVVNILDFERGLSLFEIKQDLIDLREHSLKLIDDLIRNNQQEEKPSKEEDDLF